MCTVYEIPSHTTTCSRRRAGLVFLEYHTHTHTSACRLLNDNDIDARLSISLFLSLSTMHCVWCPHHCALYLDFRNRHRKVGKFVVVVGIDDDGDNDGGGDAGNDNDGGKGNYIIISYVRGSALELQPTLPFSYSARVCTLYPVVGDDAAAADDDDDDAKMVWDGECALSLYLTLFLVVIVIDSFHFVCWGSGIKRENSIWIINLWNTQLMLRHRHRWHVHVLLCPRLRPHELVHHCSLPSPPPLFLMSVPERTISIGSVYVYVNSNSVMYGLREQKESLG